MLLQMVFAVVAEGFPARDAKVTLVLITDRFQGSGRRMECRTVPNDNVQVDDRFRGQPGHRCTADMLDPERQLSQRGFDLCFDLRKTVCSGFIIWQDYDVFRFHPASPPGNLVSLYFIIPSVRLFFKLVCGRRSAIGLQTQFRGNQPSVSAS